MMDKNELIQLLSGPVTLAFDTNTLRGASLLRHSARVKSINANRPKEHWIKMVIPALCEAEHRRHERFKFGVDYRPGEASRVLEDQGVAIVAFEETDADYFASSLSERINDKQDWQNLKLAQICSILALKTISDPNATWAQLHAQSLKFGETPPNATKALQHALGIGDHQHGLLLEPTGKKPIPATVDWFIRAQIERNQWIAVSDDTGPEWQGIAKHTKSDDLKKALIALGAPP